MTRDDLIEKMAQAIASEVEKDEKIGIREDYIGMAHVALEALAASGYAVVPKKPTDKMLVSGQRSFVEWEGSIDPYGANCVTLVYLAMLAAAQE